MMVRSLIIAVAATACGAATTGQDDLVYETREVPIGHPSADILPYDPDRDGMPDILVCGGGRLVVLEGDGTGHFELGGAVDAGEHPVDIALGDIDEDGIPDVAVANHETSYVTLLFGGSGVPGSGRSERLAVDVSPHPHAVALADVDEDGHLDLLVDDRDRERLQVFSGLGNGSFESAGAVDVGGDPYRGMTVADIDGDGHLDIVTPNPTSVAVQLGDGRGRFSRGTVLDSRTMPPFSTAVGDFDGDGNADIAAGSGEGRGGVVVWWGGDGGAFAPAAAAPFEIADGPTSLSTGDVDGDGITDLLVTSYVGDEVAILVGGDEGDDVRVVRIPLGDHPWGIASDDVDGDGSVDLMVAHDGGPNVSILTRVAR